MLFVEQSNDVMAGHGYLAVGLLALLPSICLAAYVPALSPERGM